MRGKKLIPLIFVYCEHKQYVARTENVDKNTRAIICECYLGVYSDSSGWQERSLHEITE